MARSLTPRPRIGPLVVGASLFATAATCQKQPEAPQPGPGFYDEVPQVPPQSDTAPIPPQPHPDGDDVGAMPSPPDHPPPQPPPDPDETAGSIGVEAGPLPPQIPPQEPPQVAPPPQPPPDKAPQPKPDPDPGHE